VRPGASARTNGPTDTQRTKFRPAARGECREAKAAGWPPPGA
jgi:hypothetical protein